jgi:hypothetical protein
MVKRLLTPLAVVGLGLCVASAESATPTPAKTDPAVVAKLVAQLGSERYEDREAAFKELDALGPIALEALRTAVTSRDEETRRRAVELVLLIEKRQECAQLTQPKIVHLVYADTPVNQAVQDLARKTGFQIQIEGDQTKLANRKITLDTGEVPFWQAVDEFCQKAGLVERGSGAVVGNANAEMNGRLIARRFGKGVDIYGGMYGPQPEMALVFLDGKPSAMPTYYGGALRVRVLPRAAPAANAPQNDTEGGTLLTIEVSPEPKMGLQNILSVRIDKVVDEKGAELKTPLPFINRSQDYGDYEMMMRGPMWNTDYSGGMGQNIGLSKQAPIRLRVPEGVKKLKEIHGHIAAEILTPMQPLITMEDILNASNKTVEGKGGGSLKVSEVKREDKGDKGSLTLQVVVEKPALPQAEARAARMRMMWGGPIPVLEQPNDVNAVGKTLSLVDEKGQAFKLIAVETKVLDNETGGTVEYRLTFQPPAAAAKPAKLVYLGQREATIDVPFVLKDVPIQ